MDRDRKVICEIISEMLESAGEGGIYCTSTAYTKLEHYIEQERNRAIGCTHAAACVDLDNDQDPRMANVPRLLQKIRIALE